jgi:hypothetical protein
MNQSSSPTSPPEASRGRRRLRKILRALLVLALAIIAFYAEENWRGERAWEKYRRELEAKGEVLDWQAYTPRPVPPDQNFLAVPLMDAWFNRQTKNTNDLQGLRALADIGKYRQFAEARHGGKFPIVEVQVWPATASNVPSPAYPLKDFEVDDPDAFRNNLSRAAQVAIFDDPRGGPRIIGGGPDRQPRRIHVQLDAKTSQRWLEAKFKGKDSGPFFTAEPTAETNVIRVVCTSGVLAEDAVAWFNQFQAEFDALYQACQRPHARLPGSYSAPFTAPVPNFVSVRTLVQALSVSVKANLLVGQPDAALRDAASMAQLTRYLRESDFTLVAAMIRVAVGGLYVESVGDGLAEGLWPEQHCAAIQEQLRTMDLLNSYAHAMRGGERPGAIDLFERFKGGNAGSVYAKVAGTAEPAWRDPMRLYLELSPRGWHCQNQLLLSRLHQISLDALDLKNQRIDVKQAELAAHTTEREINRFRPWSWAAGFMFPNFGRALQITARNQTLVNQTLVACALERYRRQLGQYPESLDVLAPRFLDKLPPDLFTGQPLKYRRTSDGRFLLYSVGWNEKDDGGVAGLSTDKKSPDLKQGDWVWPYVPVR